MSFVDIDPDFDVPEYEVDNKLIRDILEQRLGPERLPKKLFERNFYALIQQLLEFFGLPSDFSEGSERYALASAAKNNLALFSGAKTFQNVLELSIGIFDEDGMFRTFDEFADIAQKINSRYNISYLRVEMQAAIRQSQAIEAWTQIKEDADIFPLLRYSTVGDNRVRDEHRELDQIIKSVDDPFWDTWFPPNGFNCRCIVERLSGGRVSEKKFDKNPDPVFGSNVGKDGLIFPEKHPYFEVPKEFRTAQRDNFGFTVPTDKDIRDFLKD